MNPQNFVYKQVFNGATAKKAKPSIARSCAQEALEKFNRGQLGGKNRKASHLIEDYIKKAVEDSKR